MVHQPTHLMYSTPATSKFKRLATCPIERLSTREHSFSKIKRFMLMDTKMRTSTFIIFCRKHGRKSEHDKDELKLKQFKVVVV